MVFKFDEFRTELKDASDCSSLGVGNLMGGMVSLVRRGALFDCGEGDPDLVTVDRILALLLGVLGCD